MQEFPIVSTGRSDLVVSDLQLRRRLFRNDVWLIRWRSTRGSLPVGEARIEAGDRVGSTEIAGEHIAFTIDWCVDRRRPLLATTLETQNTCDAPGTACY